MKLHHITFSVIILALQVFYCTVARSQVKTNITLTGKVFDKSTKEPLEYATISVNDILSGKTITGAVTDRNGAFGIPGIPPGKYRISIGFLGYEGITIDSTELSGSKHSVSLGSFYLEPSTHSLQNVTIMGDKPVIEHKIDKIVYNAANDITSQGGQAIDVLKKVPQVTVDADGNVELQGNSNIRFLINGKPSSVFGTNLADALASIPASQIKSIEAITTPGARYDSQGTGGIINIILKDNRMQGVNGSVNISAGTRLENASANFNIRKNNFGINAFVNGNALLNSEVSNTQERITTDTASQKVNYLKQDGLSDFQRHGFRSGLGLDWNITRHDNITGSFGYSQFGNQSLVITSQHETIKDLFPVATTDIFTQRNSDNQMQFSSFDWDLEYRRKFNKEGQELDITYSASHGRPDGNYKQTQTLLGDSFPYAGSKSTNPGSDRETNISIDYTHPFSGDFLFETGIKAIDQRIGSQANVSVFNPEGDEFVPDTLQSYDLNYDMRIYAGYLSASFPLFKFLTMKTGARYEYTGVSIDYPDTSIPSYGTFVPSIVISHNFNKNASLKLSYSKRIERPEYRQLNPFLNISDPYNVTTGNPLLKPEIGNKFELGFSSVFKKGGNIYVALIERINIQDIKQVTAFYPEFIVGDSIYPNVSVTNIQNIGHEYNTGMSASVSYPFTSALNIRGNLMMTHRYTVSDNDIGNKSSGFRTRLNMNVTYQLPRDLVLELFGFYSSPSHSIQGKVPQFFMYTFAFRKLFLDKKASFGFTTTNPFNKYVRQESTVSAENYRAENVRKMPFRSFGISFSYKFGKVEFQKGREEEDNNYLNGNSPGGN